MFRHSGQKRQWQRLTPATGIQYKIGVANNAVVPSLTASGQIIFNVTQAPEATEGAILIQGGSHQPVWASGWDFGDSGPPVIPTDTSKYTLIKWNVFGNRTYAHYYGGFNVPSFGSSGSGSPPASGGGPSGQGVPSSGFWIGVNVDQWVYYGSNRPFINHARLASKPFGIKVSFNDTILDRNAAGYPLLPSGSGLTSQILIDFPSGVPTGTYLVSWSGGGVSISSGSSSGNTGSWVRTNSSINQRLLMSFTTPISELVVRRSGDPTTGTWSPSFLQQTQSFSTLRFLDVHQTNLYRPSGEIFPPTGWYNSEIGHLHQMVDLCNQSNSDLWLPLHHLASSGQIREVAQYIKNNLSGHCYIEHSNEVWNGIFPQNAYANGMGASGGGVSFWVYHINKTASIGRVFQEEAVNHTCVLGWQAVNPTSFSYYRGQQPSGKLPPQIHAVAIAPYFGNHIGAPGKTPTVATCKASGISFIHNEFYNHISGIGVLLDSWMSLLSGTNVQLLGYEGGQHLAALGNDKNDNDWVDLIIATNAHPEMYNIYKEYLRVWDQKTNGARMCLFSLCTTPNKHGCWGLTSYFQQPSGEAPKYRAVLDYITDNQ